MTLQARRVVQILRALGAAILILQFSAPAHAEEALGLSETDFVLLEVRLDGRRVSEGMPGYQRGPNLLLPIGELARILTLAIRTDLAKGTATGFVISEERRFHFDAHRAQVTLGGRSEVVMVDHFSVGEDDIYVAESLLEQWLPLEFSVDLSALVLGVTAREPLPLQLRLAREEQAAVGPRAPSEMPVYGLRKSPYRWLDMPFVDATVATEARDAAGRSTIGSQYSLFATGDLLLMEGAVYAGRTSDEDPDVRATLGRTDPGSGLLGPLRARSFSVGSLTVPGVEGIARTSDVGFGAALGNRPLTRPIDFDRHSLQGDLPPGWDVELYFNDALVGFQQSRPDNRYEFNDLPLLYGTNEFRLVFHGPQGQLRVERRVFLLEDVLIRSGDLEYQVAGHRDHENGRLRFLGRLDYGLTRHLSASAGAYGFAENAGTQRRYGFGGVRFALGPVLLNADATQMENGGALQRIGVKARITGLTFSLERSTLDNFASEYFPSSVDPVLSRDEVRLEGMPRLGLRFPMALGARRDTLESGMENREAAGRISTYAMRTSITAQYRWMNQLGVVSADGLLQLSRRVAGMGLRGQANYLFEPVSTLSTAQLAADRSIGLSYSINVGITREFITPVTRYSVGLNKVLGEFAIGFTADHSTDNETTLGMRLFMGFGRDPVTSMWHRSAQPMADTGAISAKVFVDRNFNGRRDSDEEPVAGAEFIVAGARQQVRSNAEGHVYLGRLLPRQYADVAIDQSTLEDPQWSSHPEGVRVLPRPGHVQTIDLPVILTSEIDGTLYMMQGGKRRGVPGAALQLLDRAGRVVRSTTSAWDGFYILGPVPPGEYLIVSPDHIRREWRLDPGVRMVSVPPNGEFVSGVDFLVEPARGAVAPTTGVGGSVAQKATSKTATKHRHTVRKGEWLWLIAKHFYGEATSARVRAIIAANPGIIPASGELQPGAVIVIPGL